MPPAAAITVDDIQLGTNEFWLRPLDERNAAFAALRDRCPIGFHPELDMLAGRRAGPGVLVADPLRGRPLGQPPAELFSSTGGITLTDTSPRRSSSSVR